MSDPMEEAIGTGLNLQRLSLAEKTGGDEQEADQGRSDARA